MPALKHRSFRGEKSDKKKGFFNFDREPKKSIISKDEMIARKAKQERDKNKGAGSNIQTKGKSKPKSSSPGSSKAGMSGKKSTANQSKFKKTPGSGYQAGSSNKTKSNKTSSAQAGSNIKKSGGKNFNVGVSKGGVSFGEAFRHFKNKGVKEFTWNGKRYTTKSK